MIETTYASFRKALELMVINTTCPCNACRNLPNLDLKFFVHFGSYVYDMHTVWERLKDTVRIEVRPEEALLIREYTFPIPPSILWEYLTKPEYRAILLRVNKVELENKVKGRTAVDSVYDCYHGDKVV